MRVYVIVAIAIAAMAFGIGQLVPGAGVAFAALASLCWTACSARGARRFDPCRCEQR